MNQSTSLSFRVFTLLVSILFFTNSIFSQCSGTETIMSNMGQFATIVTNYEAFLDNPPEVRQNPCVIVIHPMNATYIDVSMRFMFSAKMSIYDENNQKVGSFETTKPGANRPSNVIRVQGSEARLVHESTIRHDGDLMYPISAWVGDFESDGITANEEKFQ